MDPQFCACVPDLSAWGSLSTKGLTSPRPHKLTSLSVDVAPGSRAYASCVHDVARLVAAARLHGTLLSKWEAAVERRARLSTLDRLAIGKALSRGLGTDFDQTTSAVPTCQSDLFKGHIAEVLMYAFRTYLQTAGKARPLVYEPPRPKVSVSEPGIDLLEVGATKSGFYFLVWECKGIDGLAASALRSAAGQIVSPDDTANQAFMEAHASLYSTPLVAGDARLRAFVDLMPHLFYTGTAARGKRLGGFAGASRGLSSKCGCGFASVVDGTVSNGKASCQVGVMQIPQFQSFRDEVFRRLWNIF